MTGPSARTSSASSGVGAGGERYPLAERDLHLWLCERGRVSGSDEWRRWVLSRYAAMAPGEWRFGTGEHGKPFLIDPPLPLQFNLSHSGRWLVCAVSGGTPVGVDVEHRRRERPLLKLARRFFCPRELADVESLQAAAREQRFFDYWTLKESAVKARGESLPPMLRRRCFGVVAEASGAGAIEVRPEEPDACYFLLDQLEQHQLSVCWLGDRRSPPSLRLFRLVGDHIDELPVIARATSHLPMP